MFGKKKNTAVVTGIIEMLDPGDSDRPASVSVSYVVDEKEYTVTETVKMKSQPIKVGKTTVGKRVRPAQAWVKVGAEIRVEYDSADPSKGRIPANKGGRSL